MVSNNVLKKASDFNFRIDLEFHTCFTHKKSCRRSKAVAEVYDWLTKCDVVVT